MIILYCLLTTQNTNQIPIKQLKTTQFTIIHIIKLNKEDETTKLNTLNT